MLLPKFEFHEPTTLLEACQIISALGVKAKLIAGGTDLLVNMKRKVLSPQHLVSLARINELKNLDFSRGQFKIGACVTVAELTESAMIAKTLNALRYAARSLGSPLIRNLATIGGNLGSARPAADLPPSLIAYDARVILKSSTDERAIPLDNFFLGPGRTQIGGNEILTEIRVHTPPLYAGAGYANIGIRKAQDCNLVNVASFLSLNEPGGRIETARIVMGCVGPTPMRSPAAEKILIGEKPGNALFSEAGKAAAGDSIPIDDFRATKEYKRSMVGVLTQRTLAMAYQEAKN
jgi:carbon-monoxide dehydrogenase medium subunit